MACSVSIRLFAPIIIHPLHKSSSVGYIIHHHQHRHRRRGLENAPTETPLTQIKYLLVIASGKSHAAVYISITELGTEQTQQYRDQRIICLILLLLLVLLCRQTPTVVVHNKYRFFGLKWINEARPGKWMIIIPL